MLEMECCCGTVLEGLPSVTSPLTESYSLLKCSHGVPAFVLKPGILKTFSAIQFWGHFHHPLSEICLFI